MRNKFRLLALLLMVGLAFVLVACGGDDKDIDPVTQFNVLGNFVDGGDGVYTIATNTASSLSFTYAKSTFAYGYMRSATITQDLSIFKKLVITYEGSGSILVKLETSDGTPAKEVALNVTAIQGSVEWNLIADSAFLAKVDKVVIIASPGKVASTGNVTITKMEFSVNVATNFIINTGFNNIPQNENEYDGVGTTFDFNAKWEDNGDGVYDITTVGGTTVVEFDKIGFEWPYIVSKVKGDFSDFNYVVAIVSGTAGQRLILKAANQFEASVLLTADQQEVVVDISAMTTEQKNSINQILIFGLAGNPVGTGTFTIHEAFMAEEYDYEAPVFIVNEYNGTDATFALSNWYDNGVGDYEIEVVGTDTIITYDKSEAWSYAITYVEGDFKKFNVVEFEITGMSGKTALLKVEAPTGNVEKIVTFDGTRQTFTVDISDMSDAVLESINKVLIFAAQSVNIGTGTITVHSATFKQAIITYEGYDFLNGWTENDLGTYAFSTVEGSTVVDYTKGGNGWAFMRRNFLPEDAEGYNTLVMTLHGEAGKTVIVKPNDQGLLERLVTFGDQPVTIMVTAESFSTVLIFAEPNTANVTGQFTILQAVLTYIEAVPTEPQWVGFGMTVLQTETNVSITYSGTTANWWEKNAQLPVPNFDGTKEEIVFTYTGVAGQEYVFKIEGGGQNKEVTVLADGTEQVLVMDLSTFTEAQRDAFILIVVFAKTLGGEGTLVVNNWEYIMDAPTWIGYGMTVVETATEASISYAGITSNWWETNAQLPVVNFNGTKEGIVFTFTGVAGHEYLFKIEGNGQFKEVAIVANGTEQQLEIPLVTMTEAQRNGLVLIVLFVKTLAAEGTVVVNGWDYAESVEPVIPVWVGVNMTVVETETEVTITYVNNPSEWWNNNTQLEVIGFDGSFEEYMFTFVGVAGQSYVFKIEGGGLGKEAAVVADGTEQVVIVDLSTFTEVQRDGLNKLVVFATTTGASGTLVIKSHGYVVPAPQWIGYGLTVVQTETEVSITYANTPGAWWSNNAQLAIVDFDGTQEGILFTFTGVAGQTYVFKIEGNGQFREVEVVADGTLQELLIDLSTMTEAQRDGLNLIVIFSKTEGASGTLVVKNWEYPTA